MPKNRKAVQPRLSDSVTLEDCWPSVVLAEDAPKTITGAADDGSDTHKLLASHLKGEVVNVGDARPEVRSLYYGGLAIWESVTDENGRTPKEYFGDAKRHVEEEVALRVGPNEKDEVFGHPDLYSVTEIGDEIIVFLLDWKTGYKAGDFSAQLKSYLCAIALPILKRLAQDKKPMPKLRCFTFTAWVRDRNWDCHEYDEDDLLAHETKMRQQIALARSGKKPKAGDFVLGDHCQQCKALKICPARKMELAVFDWSPKIDLTKYDEAKLIELKTTRNIAGRFIAAFDDAFKQEIRNRGQITNSETEFTIETEERTPIRINSANAAEVLRVLLKYVNQEQINDATSVAKTGITEAVRENAKGEPRGTAKERIRLMLEELDSVGGLEKKQIERVKERRIKGLKNEGIEGEESNGN